MISGELNPEISKNFLFDLMVAERAEINDLTIVDSLESGATVLGLEREVEADGLFCYNYNGNGSAS